MPTLGDMHPDAVMPRCNWTAQTAPTTADDSTKGYQPGSRWLDNDKKAAYICFDAAAGKADWKKFA